MKCDMVIGATSGYTFDQVKFWVNSLERCGFEGERVIVVGNGDDGLVAQLRDRGCTVVTREELLGRALTEGQAKFADEDMSVDRYFLFWKFLSSRSLEI